MNVMLDLETMSTAPDAAIVAIGAVCFDSERLNDYFYRTIDLDSAIKAGGRVDGPTVLWWLRQSEGARTSLTVGQEDIKDALGQLTDWLPQDLEGLWGNGSDFDNVILRSAYERCGWSSPWAFRQNRCYRTLKSLFPDIALEQPNNHNALADAKAQALHAVKLLGRLGNATTITK